MSSQLILLLLFLFFIKHYIVDFLLQSEWMVKNKATNFKVLLLHAGEHALATGLILIGFTTLPIVLLVMIAELIIHTSIDYFKANPRFLGKYKPPGVMFFNLLGLDQLLHYLTYLGIAWVFTLNF